MKKSKKIILTVISVILAFILLLVSAFFILRYLGKRSFHKNDGNIKTDAVTIDDDVVNYNGGKYRLNKNIVSILVMGVDKDDITINDSYSRNGQADCIFLAAIDTEKKTFKIIPISRESMVDVETYTTSGEAAKTERMQLCLSYAYGDTAEKSSENVLKSVKRMFYGININSYVAIDLNGLARLSTLVGGVPVTALETGGGKNGYFYEGQSYNLMGKQAVSYIQTRETDVNANNRRMERQKQFLTSLISKAGNQVMDDFSKVASYYNTMMPYTSTNIDLAQTTYLVSSCITRDIGSKLEYKSIDGTMSEGEYNEFNINEESLLSIIIDTFYDKIK